MKLLDFSPALWLAYLDEMSGTLGGLLYKTDREL